MTTLTIATLLTYGLITIWILLLLAVLRMAIGRPVIRPAIARAHAWIWHAITEGRARRRYEAELAQINQRRRLVGRDPRTTL